MRLTRALLADLLGENPTDRDAIDLSARDLTHLEDISHCIQLHRLNLSQNRIASAEGLSGIANNRDLTWLNVSKNQLESLEFLQKLTRLSVLNVSHNALNRIPIHLTKLTELKALILNNNQIKVMDNLGACQKLNTLVLSHNEIEQLQGIQSLHELTKLSISHNRLRMIPPLPNKTALKELRLSHNKILSLPEHLNTLSSLEILDMGNNLIRDYEHVQVLGQLLKLHSLNLKGNPICDKPDYKETIKLLCPSLRVLDGDRFDAKFLKRKENKKFQDVKRKRKEQDEERRKEKDSVDSESDAGPREAEPRRLLKRPFRGPNRDMDIVESPAVVAPTKQHPKTFNTAPVPRKPSSKKPFVKSKTASVKERL